MKSGLNKFFSFQSNSVVYRLTMAFGLFFLGPFLGLLFLSIKTNLFGTNELLYCLIGLLISTFIGYVIMRQISNGIARVESQMAEKITAYKSVEKVSEDELENIVVFADMMSENIKKTGESLTRRMQEIHALQDLGSLPTFQVTAQSLMSTTLKRSLTVTEALGGAIFLIAKERAVCRHVMGDGFNLISGNVIKGGDFPGHEEVLKSDSIFLDQQSVMKWNHFFSKECVCAAIVPIGYINGTSVVAVLVTDNEKKWDTTTIEFLTTYFSSAGSALKMQEIGIQNKETTDELITVLSIIKILNSNLEEENLLSVITQRLQEIIPHHWVGLALLDQNKEKLFLSHTFSKYAPGVKTGMFIENKASLFHLAMKSDEPLAIDNLDSRKNYFENRLFSQLELQSCVIESLNSRGKAIGAICLGSENIGGFSRKNKRVFSMVAMGVAIALEHTSLLARERGKRAELEVLNKIGTALSTHTIKAGRVLHYILERLAELINIEAGSIMTLEYDVLVIQAAIGPFGKELRRQQISLGHGVAGYVVTTGEPVTVQSVKDNPQFLSDIDEKTGFETRSLLCVPMITNGRVIGVIELLNKQGTSFGKDDEQTVKAVAASSAIALENSRLYRESEHVVKKERFIRTVFQKYVPEGVVADILEKGESNQMTVGEKKIVTIFNVDIRGYSRMSKQASTENVVHILNYFFKRMGNIILKHNGVLDKYLGDGLLAIFGAPVASKNPALDAVLAAQEMVDAIEELSILSIDRCGFPIKIGVSINTGEAIVGNIGFEKKMEYTVIGDVVNDTFRLQDLTKNKLNSILIGEVTYQQVKSAVRASSYGLKKLDGSFMNVYEVLSDNDPEIYEHLSASDSSDIIPDKLH